MLTMPPKPMKRLEAKLEEDGSYTIRFITALRNAGQFRRIVQKEITPCLGEHDSITSTNWETRSFSLMTNDLRPIQLKLLKLLFIVTRA
jgi:hypothetical protein